MNNPTFTLGNAPGAGQAQPGGDLISDTNTQGFTRDVMEASRNQPVLVILENFGLQTLVLMSVFGY